MLMSSTFNIPKNQVYRSLKCGHCKSESKSEVNLLTEGLLTRLQIRHSYEALRNHMALRHPKLLASFVAGWEALSPISQANWLAQAVISSKDYLYRPQSVWTSWSLTCLNETTIGRELHDIYDCDMSHLRDLIATMIRQKMSHSGELFGLPYLPSEFEFGLPDMVGSEIIRTEGSRGGSEKARRKEVSKRAANAIVNAEFSSLIEGWVDKWRKDIAEIGLEAVRKHWPRPSYPPKPKPQRPRQASSRPDLNPISIPLAIPRRTQISIAALHVN
jgi:hypothetical protein